MTTTPIAKDHMTRVKIIGLCQAQKTRGSAIPVCQVYCGNCCLFSYDFSDWWCLDLMVSDVHRTNSVKPLNKAVSTQYLVQPLLEILRPRIFLCDATGPSRASVRSLIES